MDDAPLNLGIWIDCNDRFSKPCKPVHTEEQHILNAAIFQVIQHSQPELASLISAYGDTQEYPSAALPITMRRHGSVFVLTSRFLPSTLYFTIHHCHQRTDKRCCNRRRDNPRRVHAPVRNHIYRKVSTTKKKYSKSKMYTSCCLHPCRSFHL